MPTPDLLLLASALLAGLMGGAHCAAMCGGIATGFSAAAPAAGLRYAVEPNLGRVLGYSLAGALVGLLGHGVLQLARSDALHIVLRVATGAMLVVVALRLLASRGSRSLDFVQHRVWALLRPLQARLLPGRSRWRRVLLGMLWGWMPCGLSTTLLATAWLQANALSAALVMLAFGLGTLPLMVSLSFSGARIGRVLHRPGTRRAAAAFVLVAGLLTAASPWLVHVAPVQGVLSALGCLPAVH